MLHYTGPLVLDEANHDAYQEYKTLTVVTVILEQFVMHLLALAFYICVKCEYHYTFIAAS
jgi:hypothetical protein